MESGISGQVSALSSRLHICFVWGSFLPHFSNFITPLTLNKGASTPDLEVGVLEQVQTDGPGFSLCAAPLESSGPGFCSGVRGQVNERRSRGVLDRRCQRGLRARGEVKVVILIGRGVTLRVTPELQPTCPHDPHSFKKPSTTYPALPQP